MPLQTNWQPGRLRFRDKQFAEMLEAFLYEGAKEHLFLSGGRGVGKSATTKNFSQNLVEEKGIDSLFISCQPSFNKTFDGAFPELPSRRRTYGWIDPLRNRTALIVFDDISILERPSIFGNYLTSLYDQLEKKKVDASVFLTSTIPLMVLDNRYWPSTTNSRFQFKSIAFDPYSLEELRSIALERLKFSLDENSFKNDVVEQSLEFIVDKVFRHSSDVRLLLRLLEVSLKYTLKNNLPKLGEVSVQSAWEIEKESYWADTYRQLPAHRAYLLWLYFTLVQRKSTATSTGVYDLYKRGCEKLGVKPHKDRMLRNYIRDLVDDRFLRMDIRKGKDGTVTELSSDLQAEMMVTAGKNIDWASRLH